MNRICAIRGAVRPLCSFILASFVVAVGLTAPASAVSPKPSVPGQFLTGPADGSATDIVMAYISSNRGTLGLLERDFAEVKMDHTSAPIPA